MVSKPTSAPPERRGPGRPRSDEARQAILASTLTLLKDQGFNALSIEGIATHAGVGKATVYRWWPNKAALVIDAFVESLGPELHFPKDAPVREAIHQQMRRVTRLMRGEFGDILAVIIGAGQSQPEMVEAIRRYWIEPRRREARELVCRAQKDGEIRSDIAADTILDILYGPLYFRLLVGHTRIDCQLVDAIFDMSERGLGA
ncbi:MAG: TetR/AcrR family transcriptional regulator [Terriglobia bacterium]|jgi:AcrR family transcriptional regulator|nr:TetR/AcrR family transcriptional regulator [Terriglobia bacterium]